MGNSKFLDQDIEMMDIVYDEVPDTPDRLSLNHSTNVSSTGCNSHLDADHLFKQATLARKISETLDTKPSAPGSHEPRKGTAANTSYRGSGQGDGVVFVNARSPAHRVLPIVDEGRSPNLSMPKECSKQWAEVIDLSDSPSPSIVDDSTRNRRQKWLVQNGCISPSNIAKRKNCTKFNGIEIGDKCFRKAENIDADKRIGQGILNRSLPEDLHGHVPLSPVNRYNEKGNQCFKKSVDTSVMHHPELVNLTTDSFRGDNRKGKGILDNGYSEELQGHVHFSPINRHIEIGDQYFKKAADISPTLRHEPADFKSERIHADKRKGKGVLNGSSPGKLHGHAPFSSIEWIPMTKNHSAVMEDTKVNCLEGSDGTRGRTSLNRRKVGSESTLHHDPMDQIKGKRKCGLLKTRASEKSTSTQRPITRSSKAQNSQWISDMLTPVIEVDEPLSPKARHTSSEAVNHFISDDSTAMTRQIEADEMLARQLQEEFYHESPQIMNNEMIDENIAFSLQQEEDAHHAVSIEDSVRRNSRNTSSGHSNASSLVRSSFQNLPGPSDRSSRVALRSRIAQLSREFLNNTMDLDTRLGVLAALVDSADDISISNRVRRIQRDFNENDYEMLLSLDENNHRHSGASESQIRGLPQSVVQSDSNVEDCVICLETPSRGDVIHHLPCLHKFHKKCIDRWLRRKSSCPVCKSDITYNP